MDLKNLISEDRQDESPKQSTAPRLSIHNLMNDEPAPAPRAPEPKVEPAESAQSAPEPAPKKEEKEEKKEEEEKVKEEVKEEVTKAKEKKEDPKEDPKRETANEQHSIQDEIHRIEAIQKEKTTTAKPAKPKRYAEKPVWARDFIPKVTHGHHKKVSLSTPTKLSVPSITGSIPRNDFNKLVTEWIWANVEGVRRDYREFPNVERCIELELKLGNIWDRIKDRRVAIPVNTETVCDADYVHQECFFKSGITAKQYRSTQEFLQKLAAEAASSPKKKDKFIVESSHNRDLLVSEQKRNDRPLSTRVTLDVKTKRRVASIEKVRVSDLYIFLPNTLFDMRLSMSLELPYEMNDEAFEAFQKRVQMTRDKDRTSFIHGATATRIDVTKIRESDLSEPKYELELEMNNRDLLRSMSRVNDDPLYYVDLVQAFLDNGRILTRELSKA